jgi:MoxR-like ATPase
MMKLSIGYPQAGEEKMMAERFLNNVLVQKPEPVIDGETVILMQKEVEAVKVNQDLISYITKITQETRKDTNISLGASPRATLALLRASQAYAYVNGRNYVIPDDIINWFSLYYLTELFWHLRQE